MKIGLALSGGGVRGIAHIGAIKALEEAGIHPTHIAGTSAGAIVGALYAGGYTCDEMLHFFKSVQIFSLNTYALHKPGFLDTEKFYESFKKYFPTDHFDHLEKSLQLTATNILEGTPMVFKEGPLIMKILASAAYPGVFTPVKINGEYYVDGGLLNNFPVDLLKPNCTTIIGVYVNPFEKVAITDLRHSYNVMERALRIKMADEPLSKFRDCDLLISPMDLRMYGTFSLKNADAIFQLGYAAAKESLLTPKGLEFP